MELKLEERKQILFMFVLVFLMTFSIGNMYIRVSAKLDLSVHNVDTGLDYSTIQGAIDASETLDGHTILVDDGTYYEQVIINKTVRLLAASQNTTIIKGNGTGEVVSLKTTGAEIAGFTVQNGMWGIALHDVQDTSVNVNRVFNCSYGGIFLGGCSRCKIANNTVMSTNKAGIYLWESVQNLITDNTVKNTSHGIYLLVRSTNNIISNNLVMNNPQGIVSSYCNDNSIEGNTITSSSVGGIVMGGAHNNTIFHNNVLQNARQAWSYGNSSNFWDDGVEGNFWDDYSEPDLNGDGIGDTPYTIDEKNRDNHPLKGIFHAFNIIWQEETYHVNIVSSSTVSDFEFRVAYKPEVTKTIGFNITGKDDSFGFCRVMIPTALVNYPYTVLINREEVNATLLDISNSTHAYLHFTYSLSTKPVLIVPEFPVAFIFPLLTILTFLVLLLRSIKQSRKPNSYTFAVRGNIPCHNLYISDLKRISCTCAIEKLGERGLKK